MIFVSSPPWFCGNTSYINVPQPHTFHEVVPMNCYISQLLQELRARWACVSISKGSKELMPTCVPSSGLGSEQLLLKVGKVQVAEEERSHSTGAIAVSHSFWINGKGSSFKSQAYKTKQHWRLFDMFLSITKICFAWYLSPFPALTQQLL